MALYFLSYDLRNSKNYQALYDELSKFNAIRVLDSTWCFKRVNTTAGGLRDHFKRYIDADDGLIVSEVTNWGSCGTKGTPNDLK